MTKGRCAVIAWDRVNDLRAEIGDDDFAEVVAMFLEEADEVIGRIAKTVGAKALEADLHFSERCSPESWLRAIRRACVRMANVEQPGGDTSVDLAQVCAQLSGASKKALVAGQNASAA